MSRTLRWLRSRCLFVAIAAALCVACTESEESGNPVATGAGTTAGGGSGGAAGTDSSPAGGAGGTTDTSTGGSGGATATGAGGGAQDVGMMLNLSVVELMGQQVGVAIAAFYPETNIAPFDPSEGIAGFTPDTCRTPESATAECQTAADCPEGQLCEAETDSGGQPIPDSGKCENPTGAPVDIGPMTLTGFADGPKELLSNPSQQGAYTVDGAGDGQVAPGSIVGDADYTFSGDGDPAQGLGAFSGSLYVPPVINLLQPVPEPSQFGKEITIDTSADLAMQWEGSSNGFVKITIQGESSAVECLAVDDGEFTIPAAALANLTLASFTFFNIVNLERTTYGTASGPGLVNPQVSSTMTIMVNAKP